jgi:hypothetical protein
MKMNAIVLLVTTLIPGASFADQLSIICGKVASLRVESHGPEVTPQDVTLANTAFLSNSYLCNCTSDRNSLYSVKYVVRTESEVNELKKAVEDRNSNIVLKVCP